MPAGRPSKYTPELVEQAWAYIEDHEKHGDVVPSVVGMACHLNTCEKTLYNWADENPEFLHTLTVCKQQQHRKLISGGLSSDLNGGITKLMLYNHGYSEKRESSVDLQVTEHEKWAENLPDDPDGWTPED